MQQRLGLRCEIEPSDMAHTLTNLLPQSRVIALRREYRYRLIVVTVWLSVALIAMAAVLLLPTYVFLTSSIGAKQTKLASVEQTLETARDPAVASRLKALSTSAATLGMLTKVPSPTTIVTKILLIPHPGVILTGFVFTPATDKAATTVVLSGAAQNRNALRAYQQTLQTTPTIVSANLPVSAYARETDIDFAITLTLAP
jgi:hypothetical protein